MSDPVMAADGYSYERVAIEQWLATGAGTSPKTNELLENGTLAIEMLFKQREHVGRPRIINRNQHPPRLTTSPSPHERRHPSRHREEYAVCTTGDLRTWSPADGPTSVRDLWTLARRQRAFMPGRLGTLQPCDLARHALMSISPSTPECRYLLLGRPSGSLDASDAANLPAIGFTWIHIGRVRWARGCLSDTHSSFPPVDCAMSTAGRYSTTAHMTPFVRPDGEDSSTC